MKRPATRSEPASPGPRRTLWMLLLLALLGYLGTWPLRTRWAREREEFARRERAAPASSAAGAAAGPAREEIAALQRGLRGGAQDAALYLQMAAIYESLGEREPAFQALVAGKRSDPTNPAVAAALGAAHELRREYDLAIEEWRRAIRLGVPATAAPVALAALYVRLGWSREAEALLVKTRRRAPEDAGVRLTTAMLFVQTGRVREAEAELTAALRLAPEDDRIDSLLANVYELTSRTDEALAAIRRALARRPEEADYQVQLGGLLLEKGGEPAVAEAESAFRTALARAPHDARAWSGLARALRRRGRAEEAAEILAPLAARPRADSVLLREYGQLLTQLGRAEESRTLLQSAVAREREAERRERAQMRVSGAPGDADYRRALAALYLEQEDAPRAIVELKRVLAARPKDNAARALLGRALRAAGRE